MNRRWQWLHQSVPIHWKPGHWARAAAARANYWQSFESSRERWYTQATPLITACFKAECHELIAQLSHVSSRQDIQEQCSQVLDKQRSRWQMAFRQILVPTGLHFAQRSLFGYTSGLEEDQLPEEARGPLQQPVEDWTHEVEALLGERLITNTLRLLLALFAQPSQPFNREHLLDALNELYHSWIDRRAHLLASFLVVAASNYGAQLAAKRSGRALVKQWVAMPGGKLPDPHAAMDGQTEGLVPSHER